MEIIKISLVNNLFSYGEENRCEDTDNKLTKRTEHTWAPFVSGKLRVHVLLQKAGKVDH